VDEIIFPSWCIVAGAGFVLLLGLGELSVPAKQDRSANVRSISDVGQRDHYGKPYAD